MCGNYLPADEGKINLEKEFYDLADEEQLKFFGQVLRGLVDQIDHSIFIESETNKFALKKVDPQENNGHQPSVQAF